MSQNDETIEKIIDDISKIFPEKLLLSKAELARIRNISESTLNREKQQGRGIPYKKEGGRILYAVRDIAKWMSQTIQTN